MRNHWIHRLAIGAAALAAMPATVNAGVLFSDSFNRADSANIDESLTGIVDNTGSALSADGVYSQPWVDPANETTGYDGDPGNGGGAQIGDNQLQLAVGPGTSNAYVNHNFINPEILAAGGFRVSLDVNDFSQNSEGQGGAFAVGMTAAEAAATNDAFNGNPSNAKMTNAFPTEFTDTVSDFWVGLRGDGTKELAWGNGPVPVSDPSFQVVDLDSKTGTISADFSFSSFAAGSDVAVSIYFNGVLQGTGAFQWSDSDANYIGIDTRDAQIVSLDNFSVSTLPEPGSLALLAMISGCGLVGRRL
ncbi:hypothetical protein Pla123a_19180 [Posidoniimonas polymericola]|uniref:PEP-CTERM protein-sorting domain-containing protein n=1 Tax=Posidoniimonas polymericola TaxID=2528002 RepID=A0A5C5YQQ4_9BACT|nr:hypothetical protein [Posidoniimonas polymericola]TWT77261.1 hypothetical protein Pla123a_19180 [Posidoniimonas polymericola]